MSQYTLLQGIGLIANAQKVFTKNLKDHSKNTKNIYRFPQGKYKPVRFLKVKSNVKTNNEKIFGFWVRGGKTTKKDDKSKKSSRYYWNSFGLVTNEDFLTSSDLVKADFEASYYTDNYRGTSETPRQGLLVKDKNGNIFLCHRGTNFNGLGGNIIYDHLKAPFKEIEVEINKKTVKAIIITNIAKIEEIKNNILLFAKLIRELKER